MATKRKKRAKAKSRVDLLAQAKRQFAKGNYRDALKGAKACYRQDPTAARRHLLEHAFMARAQQLCEAGLRDEARAVLNSLLDLGVTEPAVEAALPDLLVTAGLWDRVGGGIGAAAGAIDPQVAAAIADQAVLHPEETQTVPADIRAAATAVRAALDALYSGDDAAASQSLKAVPRSSPLADWKLFVRGLAGYYQGNSDEMRANWGRLDPNRRARRIAQPLSQLAGLDGADTNADRLAGLAGRVEHLVRDRPVLATLEALRADLAEKRWEAAARTFAVARQRLREVDQRLADDIAEIYYWDFVRDADFDLLDRIVACVPPPAMDPHWNRARALDAEMADDAVEVQDRHWSRYLQDVAELEVLAPAERLLAQALISERIALGVVSEAQRHERVCRDPDCNVVARLRARAIECFERGMELGPQIASIAESFADAQIDWEQPDSAAETYRRLVEQIPDHFDALVFLAQHDLHSGRPLDAQQYAIRAHRIRPRDRQIKSLVVALHAAAARHYAQQKDVDRGRAELAAAKRFESVGVRNLQLLACRAVFEYAVGDASQGEQFAEQAQQVLGEPTAALLALAIESIHFELSPNASNAYFEHAWRKALKQRCQSETAGAMAQLLMDWLSTRGAYLRSADHVEKVLAYIKRCSRVRWDVADLTRVCEFLVETKLLDGQAIEKLARRATHLFPDVALFFLLVGQIEMAKRPRRCRRVVARRAYERVLDLLGHSTDRNDARFVAIARKELALLELPEVPAPLQRDLADALDLDMDLDELMNMPPEEAATKVRDYCRAENLDEVAVLAKLVQLVGAAKFGGN